MTRLILWRMFDLGLTYFELRIELSSEWEPLVLVRIRGLMSEQFDNDHAEAIQDKEAFGKIVLTTASDEIHVSTAKC